MRLLSLILPTLILGTLTLGTLFPGSLLADQGAFVIRDSIATVAPNSNADLSFRVKAGTAVVVVARKGGWKQLRQIEDQRLGWIRSYLVRDNPEYRSAVVVTEQGSQGFMSGLANMARKVSGFFTTPSASTSDLVATIGIRGRAAPSSSTENSSPKLWFSPDQIVTGKGDEAQLDLLQTYASSPEAGRQLASDGGLKARSIALLGGR